MVVEDVENQLEHLVVVGIDLENGKHKMGRLYLPVWFPDIVLGYSPVPQRWAGTSRSL